MPTNDLAAAAFLARRAFIHALDVELTTILRPRFGTGLVNSSTTVDQDIAVSQWTAAGSPLTVVCNMNAMPVRQWSATFLGKTASGATATEAVQAAWAL